MTTDDENAALSAVSSAIADGGANALSRRAQAAALVVSLRSRGYAVVSTAKAAKERAELAEELRAAVHDERLAADAASYWGGANGTRDRNTVAAGVTDALINKIEELSR